MYRLNVIFTIVLLHSILLSFAETAKVKWIIDGDTFLTEDDKKVRMIGINSTERDSWFYNEAKQALIEKIKNQTVELKADTKSPLTDKHGRLLRYVELNGTDINREMVEEGWAYAFLRYPFDRKDSYKEAENSAKKAELGLWASGKSESKNTEKSDNYVYVILFFILLIIALQVFSKFRR